MSAIIRWEEPPPLDLSSPRSRRKFHSDAIAAELRAHPGRWGVVSENGAGSLTTRIMQGRVAAFRPAGAFEAAHRTVGGVRTVYARYVGPGGAE